MNHWTLWNSDSQDIKQGMTIPIQNQFKQDLNQAGN